MTGEREKPFTDAEIEWFAANGINVARRQRLEEIAAQQRARNPLRWLWRKARALLTR